MSRLISALICSLSLAAASLSAQTEIRRAGAHEHSVGTGQLAVESGRVDLMLQIPGANLVGFEHPPRDAAQRDRLERARVRLAEGGWLLLPERARCRTTLKVDLLGFESGIDDESHGHDHAHGHDHGNGEEHAHAEFQVTASAECERPGALEWIELRLFDGWPDNRSLRVDAISENAQWRSVLSAEQPRIELQ